MKRIVSLLILTSSLSFLPHAFAQKAPEGPAVAVEKDDALQSKLRVASSQFEIISLLLDERKFSSIPSEFSQILALELSGTPFEKQLTEAAWLIAERLRESGQSEIAHEIVDATLPRIVEVPHRFSLLVMKAKIYQEQNLLDKAIATYKRAQQLEAAGKPRENRR